MVWVGDSEKRSVRGRRLMALSTLGWDCGVSLPAVVPGTQTGAPFCFFAGALEGGKGWGWIYEGTREDVEGGGSGGIGVHGARFLSGRVQNQGPFRTPSSLSDRMWSRFFARLSWSLENPA